MHWFIYITLRHLRIHWTPVLRRFGCTRKNSYEQLFMETGKIWCRPTLYAEHAELYTPTRASVYSHHLCTTSASLSHNLSMCLYSCCTFLILWYCGSEHEWQIVWLARATLSIDISRHPLQTAPETWGPAGENVQSRDVYITAVASPTRKVGCEAECSDPGEKTMEKDREVTEQWC
jgi:hypothetical protein